MKSRIEKLEAVAKSAKEFFEQFKRFKLSDIEEVLKELNERDTFKCGFCNKDDSDVKKMFGCDPVYICDECIQICVGILKSELGKSKKVDLTKVVRDAGKVIKQKMEEIGEGD